MIRVINKYKESKKEGEVGINIMRGTPLGNPFIMQDNSDAERDRVCDQYRAWISEKYKDETSEQYKEIQRIVEILSKGYNVALICCCKPKRCHGDVILVGLKNLIKTL